MMLQPGMRVMFEGGYGQSSYRLTGTLLTQHEGHLSGGQCIQHFPPCVHWSVKLDTGSEHVGYPDQFTPIADDTVAQANVDLFLESIR